ncbi:hypothetical protein M4I32_07175 [Microbacterium sp. LRZ72]|uniref:hypothetical protein n=1 Tax=Microbacterium sp. LRZ72 TaxID=2942481 RepID=UPI0029BA2EF9|nr:hypothetical protein [Microbacterium sp. LRZ72]MDX2376579.1 hypothetical protein [Microbacterium sp. LRZ72]
MTDSARPAVPTGPPTGRMTAARRGQATWSTVGSGLIVGQDDRGHLGLIELRAGEHVAFNGGGARIGAFTTAREAQRALERCPELGGRPRGRTPWPRVVLFAGVAAALGGAALFASHWF